MKSFAAIVAVILVLEPCHSRSVFDSEDESVVSVYTTQPTTAGTSPPLDVYHQIANNIAERITSPIYRFLGIGKNSTRDEKATTQRPWEKIELLDEVPEEVTKADLKPVSNDISVDRDVEELSAEALKRIDKKPEKFTLYNGYLPLNENIGTNNTFNEIDSDNDDDDDELELNNENERPREGGFVYFLEIVGSFIQLAWGAFVALFKPSNNSS